MAASEPQLPSGCTTHDGARTASWPDALPPGPRPRGGENEDGTGLQLVGFWGLLFTVVAVTSSRPAPPVSLPLCHPCP